MRFREPCASRSAAIEKVPRDLGYSCFRCLLFNVCSFSQSLVYSRDERVNLVVPWVIFGESTHAAHPLLTELNKLQEELESFNVIVLGFPCNQFGKQEPGKNSEILLGLK